ncbi:MAG: hypothetical protein LC754_16700, partial [Acidobacteria bacterium]|nr:hypothetical protein [Acidobacteriota bacterium]
VGKESSLGLKLEPGQVSEVVTVTDAATTDLSTTAVGSNLNDQLFQNIPVQRSVSSLFYLAPGASDGLGGGRDNPSISGGSALDNLYVADGVNITDSAFGGIGTFTRSYGALGTGINTSFVKEVQVKTGGFEPQYGQATGGIVNIITQSGSNEYHGALYGYARPKAFEATRKQRDNFSVNKVGELLHQENYDAGVDFGGYVPGAKDHLFFFGSFNPTVRRDLVIGAKGSGIRNILGEHVQRYRTMNYAGKIDYNINPSHTIAFSIFGDPSKTNLSSFATLNIDNTTANSKLEFGTRNMALRYNGSLSSTWTLSASLSQAKNHFDETGFANFNSILDRTQPARGNFNAIGRGFIEPTEGKTWRTGFDTSKIVSFLGSHTFGIGYQFQKAFYSGIRDRSGPKFTIPATNATGTPLAALTGTSLPIGQQVNAAFSLRVAGASCTLCPILTIPGVGDRPVFLRQDRGEFGNPVFDTFSKYHAAYMQDTWRFNRYVTALVGLRWEQERVVGSPSAAGERVGYTFTDQWAPRIGVTVDPLGRGKTKAFYNYGRFFEYLPLDLAERSLSAEQDFTSGRFAPEFVTVGGVRRAVVNQFGTVNPIIDAAHLLNRACLLLPNGQCQLDADGNPIIIGTGGGIGVSSNDPSNPILAGTKLGFIDEHIIGLEQQLPRNFTLSVRYIDRNQKRIVEDAAVVSVEQFNNSLFGQSYFLANVSARLDAAVNAIPHTYAVGGPIPAACRASDGTVPFNIPSVTNSAGTVLGAVCFNPNPNAGNLGADGIADGFPDPVHKYKAVEIELNKRFSDNWQLLSNWRIARLRGNYEGHLRNDNGQTDPGISSLFDFTAGEFGLLGDQFAVGPLNTDRRHVINIYASYAFSKDRTGFGGRAFQGLNLGLGFHAESGLPISEFLAHPGYLNAGEIPVGGRGKLGRTDWYNRVDLHADYPWRISETTKLSFIADFFNVFNKRTIRQVNEFRESTAGQLNPDFGQPRSFHPPFNMRLGARLEF